MPPRQKSEETEETVEHLAVEHKAGCPRERLETFDATGPNGQVRITRCQDCGAFAKEN